MIRFLVRCYESIVVTCFAAFMGVIAVWDLLRKRG